MPRLRNVGSVQALCDRGLFRATSALQILGGLGEVFAEGLTGIIGAAEATSEVDATAGDGTFRGTEPVNRVEVFISHTWSSGRWPKYLSMCYFLNLGIAVKSALVCWVLAVASLCVVQAYIRGICDRYYLFPLLIELPVLAFFVFFFFGQHLTGGCFAPSFWLDKLCIHQTKHDLKAQQVAALPVFVARSTRMLVLWDDTYFERLWCNMEMATFAKYSSSPEKMEFLPLWLAPWMLSSVLLDLLGVTLVCCMQRSASGEGYEDNIDAIAEHGAELMGGSPDIRIFIHMFLEVFPSFLCYLPVALPTLLSFKRKIKGHELMLEQMAAFDLKNAKCSVEADRPLVEEQVALHFQPEIDHEVIVAGAAEAAPPIEAQDSHEEALERFNNYVQGPLRAACLDSIGDQKDVPLHLCYICFLPMSFYAAVNVTPFAYGDCTMSYSTMGFDSPNHLMVTFATCWLCTQLLVFPVTFPLLLRTLQLIESICSNKVLRLLLGSIGSAFAYSYTFFCAGAVWGVTTVVSQSFSPTWLLIYLTVIACLAFQAWLFFGKRPKPSCSCRCLEPIGGDDCKPMLAFRV